MSANEKRIRQFAYEIWESEGKPEGHEERHWEMARKLVEAEASSPQVEPRKKPAAKPKAAAEPKAAAQPKPSAAQSKAAQAKPAASAAEKPAAAKKPRTAKKPAGS